MNNKELKKEYKTTLAMYHAKLEMIHKYGILVKNNTGKNDILNIMSSDIEIIKSLIEMLNYDTFETVS